MTNKLGIYVHVPFCESKCAYCDFASFVMPPDIKEQYFSSLIEEINSSPYKGREVDTIYIGGGTPSCVKKEYIANVLVALRENFNVTEDAEISMECNPNSVSEDKLGFYEGLGINRISFGVQSLQDDALKEIGRLHNSETALKAIELAKAAGIKNINADLLIGLPGASEDKLLADTRKLIESGVNHISAYMLQVEEGTAISERVKKDKDYLPSDDESVYLYEALVTFLQKQGFNRYEISNFALSGKECKHNYKYWSGADYLGFGLGSHSYIDGVRFSNSNKFFEYYERVVRREVLDNDKKIMERLMLGLRCDLGFSKAYLLSLGYDITKNSSFKEFLNKKFLIENGDNVKLNPDQYGVSNYIIVKLLP